MCADPKISGVLDQGSDPSARANSPDLLAGLLAVLTPALAPTILVTVLLSYPHHPSLAPAQVESSWTPSPAGKIDLKI